MTGDEFKGALSRLGMSQERFARLVGAAPRTGQKWALGETRVPGSVVLLLTLLDRRPELLAVVESLGGLPTRQRTAKRAA